jgi:hypothetical protein
MNDFSSLKEDEYGIIQNNRARGKPLNRPYYNTPNVLNKAIEEIEMRKTKINKPPLISSLLPAVFEFPKVGKRYSFIKFRQNENHAQETPIAKKEKYFLEPIRIRKNLNRKTIITRSENIIKQSDEMDIKRQFNKIILKPIEIKDPRKKVREINLNVSILDMPPGYNKEFEQFSKTSDLNFKQHNDKTDKVNNIKLINNSNHEPEKYKVKLEEMITLGITTSTGTCGLIKKMLHVPSLKIYTIRVK